jgi:hypothetical protein
VFSDLTIITTHFSDFRWTDLLLRRISATVPSSALREILIIDQDRTSASRTRLEAYGEPVRLLQYPRSQRHFAYTRHDHAAVLNTALREAAGSVICIFDSDAHPLSASWISQSARLLHSYDAVLSQDPTHPDLVHPCFMVLRAHHAAMGLAFDADLFETLTDTGRLIGQQLTAHGERPFIAPARAAFGGLYGTLYLDSIYHHGKGSFSGVNDPLLQDQLRWEHRYFETRVLRDRRYSLSRARHAEYLTLRGCRYVMRALRPGS